MSARQHPKNGGTYFFVSFIAYILGFITAIVMMHTLKTPQVSSTQIDKVFTILIVAVVKQYSPFYFIWCQPA